MPEQAMIAGMPYRDIAAACYRAYAASTGNKNFRGEPMPAFEDLPQAIRTAWEAAVRHAQYCYEFRHSDPENEQKWQGWVPPGIEEVTE